MYYYLKNLVPADRLVVIHADLPGVDWPGIQEHIEETIEPEHEFITVRARKTFFEMVRHRGMFPSPNQRQCTSDLKRDPINKAVRNICNDRGFTTVVNCTGIRAEESSRRSKQKAWRLNKRETNSKRTWYEWLPIFDLSTEAVFQMISDAGQKPHWAYLEGMTRLSCSFCIMSSQADLVTAARLRPELLEEYDALEREVNHTLLMPEKGKAPRRLKEIVAAVQAKRACSAAPQPCY